MRNVLTSKSKTSLPILPFPNGSGRRLEGMLAAFFNFRLDGCYHTTYILKDLIICKP